MNDRIVQANGAAIPAIGLGTWQLNDDVAVKAVHAAFEAGYRHIDTAIWYKNEQAVGEGLRTSGLERDAYFLTTKIPPESIGANDLIPAAEGSLTRLGVDQVDLLLIHWPSPTVPIRECIAALCKAKRQGLARHIGISNFTLAMVDEAVAVADEPLVANQCENHPLIDQSRLIAKTRGHGLAFVSYTPLGRGALGGKGSIAAAAAAHGKTESQIVLRWHVQQGLVAIPRSSNPGRIAENIGVFDFALSAAEMAAITALKRPDGRVVNPAFAPAWDPA
jgi:diketogulonate reductase-like aldo/keto reductase